MSVVYTDDDYLIVNLLILISMVLFEIGYAFGLRIKRREKVKQMIEEEKVDKYVERNYKASTFLLLTITLASVGMIVATRGMSNIISESAMMSQVKHMILFAPIICIIVLIFYCIYYNCRFFTVLRNDGSFYIIGCNYGSGELCTARLQK